MRKLHSAAVLGFILLAGMTPAQSFESSFSSIAAKQCRKVNRLMVGGTEYAASFVCPGRGGYKVFVDEEDLRQTLTVGRTMKQASKEPAARDIFGAFNSYDDKIEWRSGKDGRPFALIAGWSFADDDSEDASGRPKSARLLVVMRLPPGPVCKIAYVDRVGNGNAEELARNTADTIARNFRCGTDQVQVIGSGGPATAALARHIADRPIR